MSLESERKVLEKLAKARSAVQCKYHLYQRNQFESRKAIDESFEPISKPLQKLVILKKESRGWRDVGNLIDVNSERENLTDFDNSQPLIVQHEYMPKEQTLENITKNQPIDNRQKNQSIKTCRIINS